MRETIAVIGAGAWGTALALLLHQAGKPVTLVAQNPRRVAAMRAAGANFRLPGVALPETLEISAQAAAAQIYVLAMPMQHLRASLSTLPHAARAVLCCKGVEQETLLLAPEIAGPRAAVLTGPNFAGEIARGLPAAAVLACADAGLREHLITALRVPALRLYGSADALGAALGGAAKNVIAIAAGVVMGAGLGENARAALITRGLAEIARLAAALGGRPETVAGLSGLGDLLLTCTGPGSRNFSLGLALGRGEALEDILAARKSVTEGVTTAPALLARARAAGVDMPITQAVTKLLAHEMNVPETMSLLMGRALRDE